MTVVGTWGIHDANGYRLRDDDLARLIKELHRPYGSDLRRVPYGDIGAAIGQMTDVCFWAQAWTYWRDERVEVRWEAERQRLAWVRHSATMPGALTTLRRAGLDDRQIAKARGLTLPQVQGAAAL